MTAPQITRSFTTYWRPDGWAKLTLGDPVRYAGGSKFTERGVVKGSRMYMVNIVDGKLRLLGAFTVAMIASPEQAKVLILEPWTADQHLIAEEKTSAPLKIRNLPPAIAQTLRFLVKGKKSALKFRPSGAIDGQTLRGVRELDGESALLLESMLDMTSGMVTTPTGGAQELAEYSAQAFPMYEDDGRPVKARFLVINSVDHLNVVLESRGGTIGTPNERNREYSLGLRLIVCRLAASGLDIEDALVDSAELFRRGLTEDERRIRSIDFPLELRPTADARAIALLLQRGQRAVGSTSESGQGNSTRRLLLKVGATGLTVDDLADRLGAGPKAGSNPLPLGPVPESGNTSHGDDFDPNGLTDARRRVLAALAQRQGQPKFRLQLLQAYGQRCAITGCDLLEALEAAHIAPYWGPKTNHVQNGLILRADLHTLFDRGLFGIDPATWTVRSSSRLQGTQYEFLNGAIVLLPPDKALQPSSEALFRHLESFELG